MSSTLLYRAFGFQPVVQRHLRQLIQTHFPFGRVAAVALDAAIGNRGSHVARHAEPFLGPYINGEHYDARNANKLWYLAA